MTPPRRNNSVSSSRRFLLLPEQERDGASRAPRVRRYQLASIGVRGARGAVERAAAGIAAGPAAAVRL
jgi:hypothetical protein